MHWDRPDAVCPVFSCPAVRAAFFFMPPKSEGVYFFVKMQGGSLAEYILGQLPDWLFFSAYTFLLILWCVAPCARPTRCAITWHLMRSYWSALLCGACIARRSTFRGRCGI